MTTEQVEKEMEEMGISYCHISVYDEEGIDAIRFTRDRDDKETWTTGDNVTECWEEVREYFQD
jgi:hypothetical protein